MQSASGYINHDPLEKAQMETLFDRHWFFRNNGCLITKVRIIKSMVVRFIHYNFLLVSIYAIYCL